MPSYQFSRRSVLAAIEILERLNQGELTRFLLELGPELVALAGDRSVSVKNRLNNVMHAYDHRRGWQVDDGRLLGDALVEKAVDLVKPHNVSPIWAPRVPRAEEIAFARCLDVDGYSMSDGVLRRSLPATEEIPLAENEITRLLDVHGFAIPKGHLEQALDAHGRGAWAAANSQLRAFLEGLLDEFAAKLDPPAPTKSAGHARRAHLANIEPPFLQRTLNEWGDNGVGFINGLMARLHPHGAHPGLSDEADSTFRLHVVLVTARLLLARYDARICPTR